MSHDSKFSINELNLLIRIKGLVQGLVSNMPHDSKFWLMNFSWWMRVPSSLQLHTILMPTKIGEPKSVIEKALDYLL